MNTSQHNSVERQGRGSRGSPEEIEADIERTRRDLDNTLHALRSRLSPMQRLREVGDSVRQLGLRGVRATATALTPSITRMIRIDHTHVLALFRRVRPGMSLGRKQAIVTNACLALEVHAQLEEEIFYPELRKVLGSSEVLDQSVPEHDQMRELIRVLRGKDVGDADYNETVHSLMRSVLHHVADEESILLPQAENLLSEHLTELGAQMTRRRIELLSPHLNQVAVTTARSFPIATAAAAAGVFVLGWMLLRRRGRNE